MNETALDRLIRFVKWLTASGMPTPNIFTGGKNFHSKTEWVSLRGMEFHRNPVKSRADLG
jgi:hypothetical protein